MRFLSLWLTAVLAMPVPSALLAQAPVRGLNLIIVEGQGAINNIKQRTAREPIVQVEDENHRPVAGAIVVFTSPSQGASATFGASGQTLSTVTDAQGRAIARGFKPNNIQGQYQLHVTASKDGQKADADIAMSNMLAAGTRASHGSGKLIAIAAVAAAALAGGLVYASQNGGSSSSSTTPPATTVSPGTGTVAPPR